MDQANRSHKTALLLVRIDIPALLRNGRLELTHIIDGEGFDQGRDTPSLYGYQLFSANEYQIAIDEWRDGNGTYFRLIPPEADCGNKTFEPFMFSETAQKTTYDEFFLEMMLMLITRFGYLKNEKKSANVMSMRLSRIFSDIGYFEGVSETYLYHDVPIHEFLGAGRKGTGQSRLIIGLVQPDEDPAIELALMTFLFNQFITKTREALDTQKRRLYRDIFGARQ